MEFENHIKKFPECQSCRAVTEAASDLAKESAFDDKHVVFTQCIPKLGFFGNSMTIWGMVTDKGRLQRLTALNTDKEFFFEASGVRLEWYGNCAPSIDQKAEELTQRVIKFLRL